jgi:hypothetical protein
MSIEKKLLGTSPSGEDAPNVADVFSTYLYDGNSSTQTITNGIDLDGKGGLVWIKDRLTGYSHLLFDTVRGVDHALFADGTSGEYVYSSNSVTSFNSNGFSLGSLTQVNTGTSIASWTFRKAPRFFDVVTYTGAGESNLALQHNLGVLPGMVILKRTDAAEDWFVWHRSGSQNKGHCAKLNNTWQYGNIGWNLWGTTGPSATTTTFTVGDDVTSVGKEYVAYLFAHDPNGADDDGMIACGSFVGDGSSVQHIPLDWTPQYVMVKKSSGSGGNWMIVDSMRGSIVDGDYPCMNLHANDSVSEQLYGSYGVDARGFNASASTSTNENGATFIYMAIRAPMMKEPESGTDVFEVSYGLDSSSNNGKVWEAGFPVDMYFRSDLAGGTIYLSDRIRGSNKFLVTHTTQPEGSVSYSDKLDNQTGVYSTNAYNYTSWCGWMFKRAKGFFDVVCYTGNGTAGRNVSHSLGVVPEMMIVKNRANSGHDWIVYHKDMGNTKYMLLNETQSQITNPHWNNTTPTSSAFIIGSNSDVNYGINNYRYIAYLFATLDGVSKCGSYTGTGSTPQTIDCGFSGGARFVLFKRASSGGEWYFFDTERGITSGSSDGVMWLDDNNAEVTEATRQGANMISPHSSGFSVQNGELNYSGSTWIFLAIA